LSAYSPAQPRAPRRSDAEHNRAALVQAFIELLEREGADVPLYRVARRAGVGQATLYRHFPERALLALAVYEQRLDRLAERVAVEAADPHAFLRLIQELVLEETRTPGLLRVLRGAAEGERQLRHLTERTSQLLAGPLHQAQVAGVVRSDLSLVDVQLLFAMIEGVVMEADAEGRPGLAVRALDLAVRGVAAR
jgi:AcrR family transcriptional regulator